MLMTVDYRVAGYCASKETGHWCEARSAPAVAVDRERGLSPHHVWMFSPLGFAFDFRRQPNEMEHSTTRYL